MSTNLETKKGERSILGELKLQGLVLLGLVATFWLLEIVDLVIFGGSLDGLGIHPRSVDGLTGILLAPFLHGGLGHVAANTLPFLIFGWLIMMRETWHFFAVFVFTALVSGLGVWLVGASNSVHIGASGVIFGFFGFLLLSGWFERKLSTILISLGVALTYGGYIFGVLPGQVGISWEGHLFGFIGGIIAARLIARKKPAPAAA